MKNPGVWRRATQRVFSPDTVAPFLIGSLAFSILGNALLMLLLGVVGDTTDRVVAISAGTGLVMAGMVLWVRLALDRRPMSTGALFNKEQPEPHRGLVFMVSRPEACERAFEHHRAMLDRIWLIRSDQSRPTAVALEARFRTLKPSIEVEISTVNDVNDPMAFYHEVKRIYRNLPNGWSQEEVIADYVGMTAHGSAGMVLACVENQWPLQYTPAVFDHELKAQMPLAPIRIRLKKAPKKTTSS